MTLTREASEIRSEVEALHKGRGRKYSKAMRGRVVAWLERALESGVREAEWQEALGIPIRRLLKWLDQAHKIAATQVPAPAIPRPTEMTKMVPITVRDDCRSAR